MIDNALKSFQPDCSFSYFFMPILLTAHRIFIIIQMNRLKAFQSDDFVKSGKNAVQIIDNIITAVIDMAGVKAHADTVFPLHPLYNIRQLLKRAAHFCSFSRHRFEKDRRIQILIVHRKIHHIRNKRNRFLRSLFQMRSGVEII